MRLASARVQKFRNIVDSGEVRFEDLTCIVGLNEAGKTTLLQALLRVKPHDRSKFVVQEDYPRWLWKKDERSGTIESSQPVQAVFTLDDDDVVAIEERLGAGALQHTAVTIGRAYEEDTFYVDGLDIDEQKCVKHLLDSVGLSGPAKVIFKGCDTAAALAKAVAESTDAEVADELARVTAALATVDSDFSRTARRIVVERVPTFFYFDNYAVLPGRLNLAELAGADAPGSSPLQTARALLALANTTPEELSSDDYEDRKAELEAVSSDLTDEVFEYWQQNVNLRVQFDVDKKVVQNNGYNSQVERYLEVRVENIDHRYTSNFSRRSNGFQWFFSFLAAFTEFEEKNKGKRFIVLLDEPGLSLHGLAQRDLLRFINDRLKNAVQVIYTTHSPFMVESDHLDRVRIVEDKGRNIGAQVTQEVLNVGPDSLFPLQTALGYDASQNLFVGRNNVAVEGPSDLLYISILSAKLQAGGRSGLGEKWTIIPTGGASNLPAFVALLGAKTEVTVVMDSGTEGGGKVEAALDAGKIKHNRLIRVGDLLGRRHADIEDLMTVDEYLNLFNRAFDTDYSESDLGPGHRIIKRLTNRHGAFDHYRPADVLLRNPSFVDDLSPETLDNFERLLDAINKSQRRS
ncbi:MAG: AAA family ATPase [Phycicoccus sp.]